MTLSAGGIWEPDPFFLFRRLLIIFGTIYTLIHTIRAVSRWLDFLWRPERQIRLLRGYVGLQLLRIRWHRFWAEYLQIGGLLGIIGLLIWLHHFVDA